jgi:hypothetical protein
MQILVSTGGSLKALAVAVVLWWFVEWPAASGTWLELLVVGGSCHATIGPFQLALSAVAPALHATCTPRYKAALDSRSLFLTPPGHLLGPPPPCLSCPAGATSALLVTPCRGHRCLACHALLGPPLPCLSRPAGATSALLVTPCWGHLCLACHALLGPPLPCSLNLAASCWWSSTPADAAAAPPAPAAGRAGGQPAAGPAGRPARPAG